MNIKIEELIAQLAWSTAFLDGMKEAETNASDSEKNVVRAFRKCFSISSDRFNELLNVEDDDLITELTKQDPVSKLLAIYTCVAVAHAETEESGTAETMSDKEWGFIYKIIKACRISDSVRDAVRKCANQLVLQLTDIELLEKDGLMLDLIKMEIESGTFAEKHITPLLTLYFDAVEAENDLILWEENYLALKRNKRALTRIIGEFSIKKWDAIYEDLKFNIKELKKASASASSVEKKKSVVDKEKLKQEKANNKIAEQEKLNRTHEISSSHGIMYCRYCGDLQIDLGYNDDCKREYGHKYSVKKVREFLYDYPDKFVYRPVCSRCGKEGRCGLDWCR
jgi:hypothetical protein